MAWTKQGTRLALVGYLLVAGAVLGGLTWTTVLALRLERADLTAQRARDHRKDLRQSLRRLDARVQSTIIRETSRSPDEYSPVVFPKNLWHSDWRRVGPTEVMRVSPLVDTTFEPWLLGHFTVSAQSDWSSPQVPSDPWMGLPGFRPPPRMPQAEQTLAALRRSLTPDRLGRRLADAREREAGAWAQGDEPRAADYVRRKRQAEQLLRRPPELCDRRDLELILADRMPVRRQWLEDDEASSPAVEPDYPGEDFPFATSLLTGVWIDLDDQLEPCLAFVRTVSSLDGQTIYQGFAVDWPMLRDLLLEETKDLFPGATLVPVGAEPVDDPEELMTYVPVRLDVSTCTAHSPAAGWRPMHTALLLAWVAAVTVLAAAGFGVKGLLTLAQRRSQFAYAVSHELRTPLTTFRLYTDMLADGLVPEEHRDEYLKTLNTEAQRLSQLVSGVLEYSQLEHHALQPTLEDIPVSELVDAAAERFEPHCRDAERQLAVEANGVTGLTCRTDPELALQIVGTLIDNACKYARDAADPRVCLLASTGQPGQLWIDVRDFGPGVDRSERRSIFKPFRRGGGGVTSSPGTGLGLALAARWAKLLGGKLELVSTRREPGARFRLTLPLEPHPGQS